MATVSWGVLGAGKHFFLRIYPGLAASQLVSFRGIASREPAKSRSIAEEYGFARSYQSYEELLSDPEIQAVFIGLPNNLHAEWISKAATERKHILCEKPLGLSEAEARQAFSAAESNRVLLMEGLMYRFHDQWQYARALVRSGELGEVRSLQAHFGVSIEDPGNIRNQASTGGGALRDLGCYAASMARYLLQREPHRVIGFQTPAAAEASVDGTTSAFLDFGGIHCTFTVSTKMHFVQTLSVVGTAGRLDMELPIAALRDSPTTIRVTTRQGPREVSFPVQDQWARELEEFSRNILEGTPPRVAREDSIANQRVLDALLTSVEQGAWVSL